MNPRTTGILFLVACALGAFVYFYEIRGEPERLRVAESSRRILPGFQASNVGGIELMTNDGVSVEIARAEGPDGSRWEFTRPLSAAADPFVVESLASGLERMLSERILEDPQPPDVYGLGESAHPVRVEFVDGAEEVALRIGAGAPVGEHTYVSTEGSDDVHLVNSFAVNAFDKSLYDLREKRIFFFDPEEIDSVELNWGGTRARLQREGAGWVMVQPLRATADSNTVDEVLSRLSRLRAESFLDEPSVRQAEGLATPDLSVRLAGEGQAPIELTVGPATGGVRLARGPEASFSEVSPEALDGFPAGPNQLRVLGLTSFDPEAATQLELVFRDGESVVIRATKGEEGWSSETVEMEPERIEGVVLALSDLRARDILAESMGERELEGLGLVPPRVTLRVHGAPALDSEPGLLLGEVALGSSGPEGGIVALDPTRPIVFSVPAEIGADVPVSLEALRNRFLAPPEEGSDPF
ncbi:DUF4340 domain-containing protein [Myxococcota bacterium]|nr:DUF4340 domain-containing protein [Myxococcota bacterium]